MYICKLALGIKVNESRKEMRFALERATACIRGQIWNLSSFAVVYVQQKTAIRCNPKKTIVKFALRFEEMPFLRIDITLIATGY